MTYAESKLPVLHPNRNRRPGPHPRQRTPYTTPLGVILHGLSDGPNTALWQSDVLPEQLDEPRHWSEFQWLCHAVLADARDSILSTPRKPKDWREQKADYEWLFSHDDRYLFSFERICHELGWDVDCTRAGIVAKAKEAA